MCGDSTAAADVTKLMDGNKAALCFTDPPYNVDYQGSAKSRRDGIANDKMSESAFSDFLVGACRNIIENTTGGVYICMSPKELGALKQAFMAAGGHWQSYIIWVKNKFTLGGSDYQHQYEPILYGWAVGNKNHYFVQHRDIGDVIEDLRQVKTIFDGEFTTIKFQGYEVKLKGRVEGTVKRRKQKTDIWRYDKPNKSEEHPTMKPVALCGEAIKNSSVRGNIVLDLFGGSGSTLIACEQLERICYMNELDPKYCDVIRQRYWKLTHDSDEGWDEGTKPCS
jgi:DNA modification methylase